MITLKDYQTRVLDSLCEFFRQAAKDGRPEEAFNAVRRRNNFAPIPYLPASSGGLPAAMPYVCLRVPTGGGKTLLACYAAGLAMREFMHADSAVVLWLVPSNTILDQTADALRDERHPYRRALEMACGAVEVKSIEEALALKRGDVEGQTVVIVSTIQAFRVDDTTGRKVYDGKNGNMPEHFEGKPVSLLAGLELGADGKPKNSLVNMLRMRRPIVIVDEAHNARTELSFAALGAVQPTCIVEFTATPSRGELETPAGKKKPNPPSNVLHRVTAAELNAAQMVKLPLRVFTRHPGQGDQLLAEAISLRASLETLAVAEGQATAEYLRPILLIQAQRVDDCEPLRDRLVQEFNISKDEVKISVGRIEELKGIADIASPKCPVRFILTVEKLREGWDCPFAYVLCSLKETRSATAIEQIVGRILRLPHAQTKQHPELNCSYAFSVSDSMPEVLNELREALESNGFTAAEAARIVLPAQSTMPLGSQPQTVRFEAGKEIDAEVAQAQETALAGKVKIDVAKGEITVFVPLDKAEMEGLKHCVKTPEAKRQVEEAVTRVREAERAFGGSGQTRPATPYEQQLDFIVPLLCVFEDGKLWEFEKTFLLEHPWKLSAKDAGLSAGYNPLARPTGKAGLVEIGVKGEVQTSVLEKTPDTDFVTTLHQQVMQLGGTGDWTEAMLVAWLDGHLFVAAEDRHEITAGESAEFLRKVIRGLTATFSITDVGVLALDRFRLRDEIETRIRQHRDSERKVAFEHWLALGSALTVSEECTINFHEKGYEPSELYEGSFQFKKHYFGPRPGELREKKADGKTTEEFECAQFIDGLPEVKFWVRNLTRKSTSFRLQTSKDWFYPDFVCQLNDGRVLTVEYKGAHLYDGNDAGEKRAVGSIWERRSGGRCLFVMPTARGFEEIRLKVQSSS